MNTSSPRANTAPPGLHRAKKSLGQHFLMHTRIAERIALVAQLAPDSVVLEIGPGTGILTRALLARASKVIAIEADRELFEKLQTDFAAEIDSSRLELIHGDIRKWPTPGVGHKYQVVANIPYYLTGEIFRLFLEAKNQPSSMTLLVQKEVAERIARSEKESLLSLSVKAYGTPKYEFTVPRGAFRPAPRVDSAVLTVCEISRKRFCEGQTFTRAEEREKKFFTLIHAAFAHKRKLVRNNLAPLVSLEALRDAGVHEGARAEDIPLSAWLDIVYTHTRL